MNAETTLGRLSRNCALLIVAVGAVGLATWWQHAGGPVSAPATLADTYLFPALFIICGSGLLLQQDRPNRALTLAGQALGLLVFALTCGMLLYEIAGLNTGVGRLLEFAHIPPRVSEQVDGFDTLLPFCIGAMGLVSAGLPRRSWLGLHTWLGWFVLSAALLGLVSACLTSGRATIPPLTVLGLILFGLGLIGARLEISLRNAFGNARALGMPVVWLVLVGLAVPLVLYAASILILHPATSHLQNLIMLVTLLYSTMLQGLFALALRRMDTLDQRRREAEGSRDSLLARLQQQAATLEVQVSERTRELNETSERLQLALRSSNFGVWDWDIASQRLLWDSRQLEIYGFRPGEFDGRRSLWIGRVHPDDRDRLRQLEQQILESANVYTYTFRIMMPGGGIRHIEAHGFVQRDRQGQAQRVIGINRDITDEYERAQAVEALNQRLQFVLNATGYGVWEYDLEHQLIRGDVHMLQIYGRPGPEFSCRVEEWRLMIHQDDWDNLAGDLRKLVEGSMTRLLAQHRILRSDGSVRWVEVQGYALRIGDGPAQRIIGLTCDVTETRELRENLRITEERWQLALSSNNDGVWDWNIAKGEVYRDARCLDIVGYAPGELPSDRHLWQSIGHPDDVPATNTVMAEYLEGRVPIYQSEYRVRHQSGRWVWMLTRGKIVARDSAGRPLRMVGTKTDVTQRKELEERLRHGEELSLQLGRLAQIGAWEWNLATNRLTWSPEMFRIHEVDLGFEPTMEKMLEFYLPESRRTLSLALDHAQQHGTDFDLELPFQTDHGHQLWVRVLGRSELKKGSAARIYGAFQDITNRKEAENTRRTLESQLFQAQKMETLGTLAGGIAHDFNNLLTGILGYQDLALDTLAENDQARNYLSASREASMRARELIEQILTFSRQAGSEKVPVSLGQIMEDARRFLRATLPTSLRIEMDIAPNCRRVLADTTQIHQVLLNLGSNSAHAMRATGGAMTLTLKPLTVGDPPEAEYSHYEPGDYVQLDFSDTGHGMEEDVRKRIFDPFFTTKEVGQGTGLGLSVVHGIIQAHNGTISVRSAPGKGTTFTIILPVAREELNEITPVHKGLPRGAGELIAVVDDEDIVRSFAQMALEKIGYRVVSFDSPTQCLEVMRRSHADYALLLTDQTMPMMKGLELAAQVRSLSPRLPVVIMSGYFSRITPEKLAQIGQVSLLSKPFTNEELARVISLMLHPEAVPPTAG